jgi:hypothetical protein
MNLCQRWNTGRDSYRPAGEVIDPRCYEVASIADDKTAKSFVLAHHYSGSYPAARRRFGLYRGADLVGVAVFSHPSNDKVLSIFVEHAKDSTELGRFVLLDSVEGNGETFFLGRCFALLRAEFRGVVSFSDPTKRINAAGEVVFGGHLGTIYQAHNAVYLGLATPRTLHLLPDGSVLSARTLQKIRTKERGWEYAAALLIGHGAPKPGDDLRGWLKEQLPRISRTVRHPGNHRYAWELAPRRKWSLPASQPYPKPTTKKP